MYSGLLAIIKLKEHTMSARTKRVKALSHNE